MQPNNDLISRSALWSVLGNIVTSEEVETAIANAPAVDAVEVVRCKDCKCIKGGSFDIFKLAYCNVWKTDMQADNFCCFGERRINDGK